MNFGGPAFVLAIIGISMAGWMFTTWIRAKHGYPVENEWGGTVHRTDADADRKIALLESDNAKLASRSSGWRNASRFSNALRPTPTDRRRSSPVR